ncbi:MAG: hypothetical protein O5V64_447 [Wigglesworthia glossinidia]|nr:hypothetical protein [Wigglesworthia glossinidia]
MSINSIKSIQFINKLNSIEKKNNNQLYKRDVISVKKKQKNQDIINLFFKKIKHQEHVVDIKKIEKIRNSIEKNLLFNDFNKIADSLIEDSIFLSK